MRKIILLFLCSHFIFSLFVYQEQILAFENVRSPVRAGQFYPASREALSDMIDEFFKKAVSVDIEGEIVGLWAPHAGYIFSGQVAANSFLAVKGRKYDAVIIIGGSHSPLRGGSIGNWDAYRTPLGDVAIHQELADKIRSSTALISSVESVHRHEHSVEVQIPFIQKTLPGVPIVPILLSGDLSHGEMKTISRKITGIVNDLKVLFVASSDMSHYPSYKDAYDVDLRILDKVSAFDTKGVLQQNDANMRRGVKGLQCSLCGPAALVTTMLTSKELGAKKVHLLPYANSGDISGERNSVVGYGAALFYNNQVHQNSGGDDMSEDVIFTKEEKKRLLEIARESILNVLNKKAVPEFIVDKPNLKIKRGVFVTLTNHGRLRGCIGHFDPDRPLYQLVSHMAVASVTQDYRFAYNPVSLKEMDKIDVKISVLSDLKKVNTIDEIEIGKHGIWITQGGRSGTYLPEVATEMGWNKIEFLEHCCVEKAGLSKDAWQTGADIYVYSSQIFGEKDF